MKRMLINTLVKAFDRIKKASQKYKYVRFREIYSISESFRFNGEGIQLYGDGKIIMDDYSYLGSFSSVQAVMNHEVSIGKYCAISHNVRIYTSTYVADQNFATLHKLTKSGSVKIGDGVWIGANVVINPGVVIGDNSVIGANSVVTKNVDANSIVAGVPATFIRRKKVYE
ncbi:MAG: acyltransferase [Bacteroidetes bacterium CHB5]|nr:acyltransferase [Bacteroidetes bacterium CHB5]